MVEFEKLTYTDRVFLNKMEEIIMVFEKLARILISVAIVFVIIGVLYWLII